MQRRGDESGQNLRLRRLGLKKGEIQDDFRLGMRNKGQVRVNSLGGLVVDLNLDLRLGVVHGFYSNDAKESTIPVTEAIAADREGMVEAFGRNYAMLGHAVKDSKICCRFLENFVSYPNVF